MTRALWVILVSSVLITGLFYAVGAAPVRLGPPGAALMLTAQANPAAPQAWNQYHKPLIVLEFRLKVVLVLLCIVFAYILLRWILFQLMIDRWEVHPKLALADIYDIWLSLIAALIIVFFFEYLPNWLVYTIIGVWLAIAILLIVLAYNSRRQ